MYTLSDAQNDFMWAMIHTIRNRANLYKVLRNYGINEEGAVFIYEGYLKPLAESQMRLMQLRGLINAEGKTIEVEQEGDENFAIKFIGDTGALVVTSDLEGNCDFHFEYPGEK